MPTTYDIQVTSLPVEEQRMPKGLFAFIPRRSIAVRGFTRTVNAWTRVLLTVQGSDAREPDLGTPLASLFGSNVSSEGDIEEVCRLSVRAATSTIQSYQAIAAVELVEEGLADAEILEIRFDPGGLGFDLYVLLSNAAGQRVPITIPVRVR